MANGIANPTGEKGVGGVLKESERKSAFDPKKPGMFTGDYKIQKLQIISPIRGVNKPVLLQTHKSDWTEINFYEDIDSPIISGDITIQDAVGIIESTPIVGEETLEVTMQTAGATPAPIGTPGQAASEVPLNQLSSVITNSFRIYKVDPPKKMNVIFEKEIYEEFELIFTL